MPANVHDRHEIQLKNYAEYGSFERHLWRSQTSPAINSTAARCVAFTLVVLCTTVMLSKISSIHWLAHWFPQPLARQQTGDALIHVAILIAEPDQHRSAHAAMRNIISTSSNQFMFHVLSRGNGPFGPLEMKQPLEEGHVLKSYDLDHLPAELQSLEDEMVAHTVGSGKALMYKTLLHRLLPADISRVILWDVDVFTFADLSSLWMHFYSFKPFQLFGMAPEQQSTYYNWWPDEGQQYFPGFNDGVQLLDLAAMRQSALYNGIVAEHHYGTWLPDKTSRFSSGGLGDQDFYSVLGHQHPELFYILPCGWNRQLCEYWLQRLPDVHAQSCRWSEVRVLHGNCDLPWTAPCSPQCHEGLSAKQLVMSLLRAPCGGQEVQAIFANLQLQAPKFNCSKFRQ